VEEVRHVDMVLNHVLSLLLIFEPSIVGKRSFVVTFELVSLISADLYPVVSSKLGLGVFLNKHLTCLHIFCVLLPVVIIALLIDFILEPTFTEPSPGRDWVEFLQAN
jgi:hypothetical protein